MTNSPSPMLTRFLAQLKMRGLSVGPGSRPGELLLHGPAAERSPEIMAALKAFKAELVLLHPFVPPATCHSDDRSPPEPEGERCQRCQATVYHTGPEIQRLCGQVLCPYWKPGTGPEWLEKERGTQRWLEQKAAQKAADTKAELERREAIIRAQQEGLSDPDA